MHDMKAIREAAELIVQFAPHGETDTAAHRLAAFVRDITDETPLTVEALVREGGTWFEDHDSGEWCIQVGNIVFGIYGQPPAQRIGWWELARIDSVLAPRTVGDLRRLLHQLERAGGK